MLGLLGAGHGVLDSVHRSAAVGQPVWRLRRVTAIEIGLLRRGVGHSYCNCDSSCSKAVGDV